MRLKTLPAALASVIGLTCAATAFAHEIRLVQNPEGRTMFEARFFDVGDGPYLSWGDEEGASVWPWRADLQDQILGGLQYWAEVIQPVGSNGPSIVNIGTDDEEGNAFGGSPGVVENGEQRSLFQQNIQGRTVHPETLNTGAHGFFGLGDSSYAEGYRWTQIPATGLDDVFNTAIHEVAHGLGLTDSVFDLSEEDYVYMPYFEENLSTWATLLRDDNGNPARPLQPILCSGCHNEYDPLGFDARNDRSVLVGPHIREVLAGGLPGVPVKMLYETVEGDFGVDNNYMSHIELKNSMMSHQNYRNYAVFMEAELAVLQDLGYTIDRRNFFGRSVYGSGLDVINDQGFFGRNAGRNAYVQGTYNTATTGLGLHVYGDRNRVRQTADLLSAGAGGAGIRVDGEGNTLIVDRGTRVHANGTDGQGVMFAYGRNHMLVHRGEIQATGTRGVGIRFDFGNNALGNWVEYRGSYIRTFLGEPIPLLPELDGSLVRQADITGRVAGSAAAIYIAPTAHVGSVNLMQGASIEGDIVSGYGQRDESGRLRLTTVSFGQRADEGGQATGGADDDFRLSYAGDIRGRDNLTLSFDGGQTHLTGNHVVQGATVREGARLSGTSSFALADGTRFVNAGTVAPGGSAGRMTVDGDFQQTATGRLETEFNADGLHDTLAVSGAADLAGTLALAPVPDWYSSGWSLQVEPVVEAAARRGEFDTVTVAAASPTLAFSATQLGAHRYAIAADRAADAYSQYGRDANERAAGRALARAAARAGDDSAVFFRSLDFSAGDGSDVSRTLGQVSPAGYSAGLAASLQRERDVMSATHQGFADMTRKGGSEWTGYALAFGGDARQDDRNGIVGYDATTYGLVAGGGRRLGGNADVSVGLHLDIAEQSVKLDSPRRDEGGTTAFGVGAQLQYLPDAFTGPYAHGGFRIGIERGDMERSVGVGDYHAVHKADWTGHSASVQTGGGYRFELSPTLSIGPFASLAYARVSRPGVDESGPAATRLSLDSRHIDALRSSLGMGVDMMLPRQEKGDLTAYARISWDREWLDRDVVQTARFAGTRSASFETTNTVLPRNSLGLRAGLEWSRNERFTVGAGVSGQFGGGYRSVDGRLNLRWAF